jgi:hypothetical protein
MKKTQYQDNEVTVISGKGQGRYQEKDRDVIIMFTNG